MASVHIKDIQNWLAGQGQEDALVGNGLFLEIRFDDPRYDAKVVDNDFAGRTLTADCPYGVVTISFDDMGQLQSLDIS